MKIHARNSLAVVSQITFQALSVHWLLLAGGKERIYEIKPIWIFSVTVVWPKCVQNNHESQLLLYQDVTAGANSFHAAVYHRLQARVHPFLTIQRNTKQSTSPSPLENEKEPFCILPSCGQMLMHDEHRGLFRFRPASTVCLRLAEGPLRDVLQRAATQTSTGAWSRPHSARCCIKWWVEAGGGSCTIWDTVMWATWGTQRMNATSPVSVLAGGNGNGFKAWRQKIKTNRER